MDYRKQFRVKPGQKLRLNKLDPAYASKHESEADSQGGGRTLSQEARPPAGPSLRRAQTLGPHRVAGDGRRRQGRHDQACVQRRQSAGRSRRKLQAADPGRIRARLSLARPRPSAKRRGNRDFQPLALRGRAGDAGPQAHRQGNLARRYQHICDFEALLAESGTTILKFFLHISKEEQLARFAQRLDDPARNWKISESDYSERKLWDDYIEAFEDAMRATSTDEAPWYVIPVEP